MLHPKKTKILDIFHTEGIINVNFSNDILSISDDKIEKMLESITFSLLEIEGVNGVIIKVDGKDIFEVVDKNLPEIFTKDYGINKKYDITGRKDIQKIVIYYIEEIEGDNYYVPITKYVDDNREKINIIIDDLSSSYIYEANLMSFLHSNVELLDYYEQENVLFLNFNDYLFDSSDKVLEEVLYSIAYSVFANYDVSMVMFEVNDQHIDEISRDQL